jgi:cell division protein FtsB
MRKYSSFSFSFLKFLSQRYINLDENKTGKKSKNATMSAMRYLPDMIL